MDAQSWGVFLVVLGLTQVVLAGIFLRRNEAGKPFFEKKKKDQVNLWWLWVGRFGTALSMIGVLIILMKA